MLHLDDVGLDNPSTLDKGFEVVEVPGERSDRCCIHLAQRQLFTLWDCTTTVSQLFGLWLQCNPIHLHGRV
ncbi:hypothetical protein AB205_0156980 [Aquarana catesbeiana]|uniref:Uncharacterized protein n=1 Tax=Aquarana catesbeiana TaxID=8400 RepID=A0A2G9RQP0_AQUCT|nr:hypothetical protein AB205_0156980 [Aquarana catesbeiana]